MIAACMSRTPGGYRKIDPTWSPTSIGEMRPRLCPTRHNLSRDRTSRVPTTTKPRKLVTLVRCERTRSSGYAAARWSDVGFRERQSPTQLKSSGHAAPKQVFAQDLEARLLSTR